MFSCSFTAIDVSRHSLVWFCLSSLNGACCDLAAFTLQISRKWAHHVTTLLFFGFGFWSLWGGFHDGGYTSLFFPFLLFDISCVAETYMAAILYKERSSLLLIFNESSF